MPGSFGVLCAGRHRPWLPSRPHRDFTGSGQTPSPADPANHDAARRVAAHTKHQTIRRGSDRLRMPAIASSSDFAISGWKRMRRIWYLLPNLNAANFESGSVTLLTDHCITHQPEIAWIPAPMVQLSRRESTAVTLRPGPSWTLWSLHGPTRLRRVYGP